MSPLPLAALSVMIVNDHLLRSRWPSWLTGKLSDFAVVLYFPFLVTTTLGLILWLVGRVTAGRGPIDPRLTHPRLLGALAVTGVGLASINLSTTARDLYVAALEAVDFLDLFGQFTYTVDPSDCIALLLLPVSWWWGRRYIAAD